MYKPPEAPLTPPAVAKCNRRLLPLFVALIVLNYIDRTALAFAALQLCSEGWFTARVFGIGGAAFYIGYVLFQVPANLVLVRVGPRVWLPAIAAAWGSIAASFAAMDSAATFAALRLALGVAEAGAFPACWYTLSLYYPRAYLTVPYSALEASIAVSQIVAAPLAAALLQMHGLAGLEGWRWLFLVEGCASVALACVLRAALPDSPDTAPWLDDADKAWLREELAAAGGGGGGGGGGAHPASSEGKAGASCAADGEEDARAGVAGEEGGRLLGGGGAPPSLGGVPGDGGGGGGAWGSLRLVACSPAIWYLAAMKAMKDISLDGLVYFVPTLVHGLLQGGAVTLATTGDGAGGGEGACGDHSSQLRAVLLTAVPFGTAAAAAMALGASSEARDERRLHVGLPLLVGGAVFALMPAALAGGAPVAAFACLVVGVVGADATTGPFWHWVTTAAPPGTSAVALALVNSAGKAGGSVGPLGFGLLVDATHSFLPAILMVSAALALGGALALGYWGDGPWGGRAGGARYRRVGEDPRAVELALSGGAAGHGAARGEGAAAAAQQQQQLLGAARRGGGGARAGGG